MFSAEEMEVVRLSLRVALWSALGGLPVAVLLGWLLGRFRFFGKTLLDGFVHLPLVLPPVVVGYGLLLLFGRNGPIGRWLMDWFGVTVAFTWEGAALAAAVMGLPLAVRAVRLSAETVDVRLEHAARTLGSPPWRVFLTVTLPLMAPGIVAGVILSFARSLGEFGATITFVANIPGETRTLPLAIYTYTEIPGGEGSALRLAILSVILAFAALFGSELLDRWVGARLGLR